jgi:hypothetical protein
MKAHFKLHCSILVMTLVSACGGGGGDDGPTPVPPNSSLAFVSSSPTVVARGTSGVTVSVATNKATAQVSYIVVDRGDTAPTADEYFSDTAVPNRFNFDLPSANAMVAESNDEGLVSSTQYDVYVAAKSDSETVIAPDPFAVTTADTIVGDVWPENCDGFDSENVIDGNVTITNSANLPDLDNIFVIDGILTLSSENISVQADLNNLVCVRELRLDKTNNLQTLNVDSLKVVGTFGNPGYQDNAGLGLRTLSFPELISVRKFALTRMDFLSSISMPKVEVMDELYLNQVDSLENLSIPELTSVRDLTINTAALTDFSNTGKLREVTELLLHSLPLFSFENDHIINIKQKLTINSSPSISHLGGLRFDELVSISLIGTPLDDDDLYRGDVFEVESVNIVSTGIRDIDNFLADMQGINSLRLGKNHNINTITFNQAGKLDLLRVSGHNSLTEINILNLDEIVQIEISEDSDGDTDTFDGNPELQSISFSRLATAHDIVIQANPKLVELNVPELVEINNLPNNLPPHRCFFVNNAIVDFEFPDLETATCDFLFQSMQMETLSFPSLTTMLNDSRTSQFQDFDVGDLNNEEEGNSNLTSISLPELINADSAIISIGYNPLLEEINVDKLAAPNLWNINISNNASLNQCDAVEIWTRVDNNLGRPENNGPADGC